MAVGEKKKGEGPSSRGCHGGVVGEGHASRQELCLQTLI